MRLVWSLENLIDQLLKLPTIGPKTAQRLVFVYIKNVAWRSSATSQAIIDAQEKSFSLLPLCYLTDTNSVLSA